ncbi:MAG: hypothetical protein KC609_12140 [Myxococcales bacterium]|nr:hypothetical protein [Myxococcales bacterium]
MEFHFDLLFQQDRSLPMLDEIRSKTAGFPLPVALPAVDQSGFFSKLLAGFRF